MSVHTVIHAGDEVEVVSGDVSGDPQLQHASGRQRFWVAVAKDHVTAHRWAEVYRHYSTDQFPHRFFTRLIGFLTEGVPKQHIAPVPRRVGD